VLHDILKGFATSKYGKDALNALKNEGIGDALAIQVIEIATEATGSAMREAAHRHPNLKVLDLAAGHSTHSLVEQVIVGLLRGEEIPGAFGDESSAMVGKQIAQKTRAQMHVDAPQAQQIASTLTPFIVHYVHYMLWTAPDSG